MRRFAPHVLLLGAALAVPLAPDGGQRSSRERSNVTVQLLAINDLHGHLEPPSGSNGQINSIAAGGTEYLATHLKNAIKQNPNSIVVAAGDLIGASPLVSGLFHDEPAVEALNAMNLAVASVGNHEFDEGFREILRMKRGGCHPRDGCQDGDGFGGAAFQYLSANVIRKVTRTPLFPATAIRTVGGMKIGFIGETTRATSQIVPPAVTRDLTFIDEASTANAYAARLKRQGVNAVVLLIHEGGRQRTGEKDADPNGCADFSGPIESIVKRLTTDIHAVISAHSHAFYNCRIGDHLVTSAGSYGRMVTRVNLEIDPSIGRMVRASATNHIVTRDVAKDPTQTRIVEKYAALVEGTAAKVVGSVAGDLARATNAAGESPLGSVIADAQLAVTSAAEQGGAVVAFMNRGGIRADIVASAQRATARPGEVTYRDLHNVQPFGNVLTVITMTGRMIKRLLEQQFDNPAPGQSKILQVSSGFTYQYRSATPAGQHVDADSIQINGRRVAPTDRLRVTASDFLVAGGDGFSVFTEGTNKVVSIIDIDALVAYFNSRSPVAPPLQNRIARTDGIVAGAQRPAPDVLSASDGDITVVPITHGTIEILHGPHVILVDPARFTPGASLPFAPPPPGGRVALPPGIRPEDPITVFPVTAGQMARFDGLKTPTLILVTDDHGDHLDANAIDALKSPATRIVGPAVITARVKDAVTMANGEKKTVAGVTLEAVAMYNLRPEPGFTDVFHTRGRGNGYIVSVGGKRLYIAGDTACTDEMKALENIDVAFLPMNLPATMSPADAAECAKAFKPKIVYPYHYFEANVDHFVQALSGSGIEVRVRDWYVGVPRGAK